MAVGHLEEGFCPLSAEALLRSGFAEGEGDATAGGSVDIGHGLEGVEVDDGVARSIDDGEAFCPRMLGAGYGIGLREDIAREGEIVVPHAELAEEGGGQVGLVADSRDAPCTADGAASPDHGDVLAVYVVLRHAIGPGDAVVGEEHKEGALPHGGCLEGFDIFPEAMVEVGKGIADLSLAAHSGVGHFPRFVAGKGKKCGEPRSAFGGTEREALKGGKGDAVRHAPVVGATLGLGKIDIAPHVAVARGAQIAGHIREVAVASVKEIVVGKMAGDARQAGYLTALTHDADIGEGGVTAEGTEHAAVRAEGVGIALVEEDALAAEAVEAGSEIGHLAAHLAHNAAAAAFEDDDHYLHGTVGLQTTDKGGGEQTVAGGDNALRVVVERGEETGCFGIVHKGVGADALCALAHGGEKREDGIDGAVVEELARTVIHGRHAERLVMGGIGPKAVDATDAQHHDGQKKHIAARRIAAHCRGEGIKARSTAQAISQEAEPPAEKEGQQRNGDGYAQ